LGLVQVRVIFVDGPQDATAINTIKVYTMFFFIPMLN
jgi:hypothetical protein